MAEHMKVMMYDLHKKHIKRIRVKDDRLHQVCQEMFFLNLASVKKYSLYDKNHNESNKKSIMNKAK